MLATIRNRIYPGIAALALMASALLFSSCASKEQPPLIADPRAANETALPWNEQQKWEREGDAAMLNQQRR
ncbi:MAG TPA: hypothetical protein VJS88_04505 [Chthoniobacterales bacterium]|nr:hypothetical protein [Chthoniobacterales bacterium]